jgi:hypothetical protein
MNGRYIRGRHIPWEELHDVVCREEWWIERMEAMEASMRTPITRSMRDLAMMATCTCCRFHTDFPSNLLNACEAIGMGHPRPGRSCCHVSPARWQKANEYVAAIQGKLRGSAPKVLADDGNYDPDTVSRVYSMMGEQLTSAQNLLFRRYLFVLINRLKWATNFHLLGDAVHGDPGLTFRSFNEYHLCDETTYFDLTKDSPLIKELDQRITRNIPDGETWIRRLDTPEQPLCHIKYLRYQDIRISSIGYSQWRRALPLTPYSKERVLGLIDAFDDALKAWCDSRLLKDNPIYDQIAFKLGRPTATKKALIRHFLLRPQEWSQYYWLKDLDRTTKNRGY